MTSRRSRSNRQATLTASDRFNPRTVFSLVPGDQAVYWAPLSPGLSLWDFCETLPNEARRHLQSAAVVADRLGTPADTPVDGSGVVMTFDLTRDTIFATLWS